MEAHGSLDALKKAIQADYRKKAREINSHKAAQIKEIRANAALQTSLVQKELSQDLEARAAEARAMVLNEQKLSAKRAFEEAREAMVREVLSEARERFSNVLKSSQYLGFVKRNSPSNAVVYGSPFLKKHFRGLKPDTSMNGLKFVKGQVIYDFGLESLLESRESAVRERVISTLW